MPEPFPYIFQWNNTPTGSYVKSGFSHDFAFVRARARKTPKAYLFAMRFHPFFLLAAVPAFLLVSCANDECCSAPGHEHDVVADDYHVTGNCAMEFTAADSAARPSMPSPV